MYLFLLKNYLLKAANDESGCLFMFLSKVSVPSERGLERIPLQTDFRQHGSSWLYLAVMSRFVEV